MEKKKFNFNEVTVRIHDVEKSKAFADTFSKCENKFASSKSAFMVYLAEVGLQQFNAELEKKEVEETPTDDIEYVSEVIDGLITYLRNEGECNSKRLSEILSLTTIILPLVIELLDGSEVDKEEVLKGKYGNIPSDIKKKFHN